MDTDLEQAQCWNRYSLGFFGVVLSNNLQFKYAICIYSGVEWAATCSHTPLRHKNLHQWQYS